jgi:glycosyltransferase involved in cell wall biosynthesis
VNQPIKVLHIMNSCVDGSITRIVERIIRFSTPGKYQWFVASVNDMGAFASVFETLGAQVIDFSPHQGHGFPTREKISRFVSGENINIVHTHTPRTIWETWRALRIVSHKKKHPYHLATKHLITHPHDRKWGLAYTLFDRLTFYMPDHLVTVSKTMAKEVLSQPGISTNRVTAIPNGIPVDHFYQPQFREGFRQQSGLTPDMVVIGYTGRIAKVKRLDILIEAFAEANKMYPGSRLLLAGEGAQRSELETQVCRLGLENKVRWLGFTSNIPSFLAGLDIYMQTSINEGLSLSILEAMAAEKSVIATRVGSAEEIIQDGKTGILIPPGSTTAASQSLLSLLDNPEKRSQLAKSAKEYVSTEYGIQHMVDGYERIYCQLMDRRSYG